MSDTQIVASKTVNARPEQLFALLSTPARHREIDGADMLRGTDTGQVTDVGDEFVMQMRNDALGDYEMKNQVVSYEQNRKIGWAPSLHPPDGYTDKLGDVRASGHTYTWELEPTSDGRTRVTQTYDWSNVTDEEFKSFFPMLSKAQLDNSIDNAAHAAT